MEIENIILNAVITMFSFGMLLVTLLSYRRFKHLKLLFVSIAFLMFFLKGLLQSLSLFFTVFSMMYPSISQGLFDVVILLFLFFSTLKR
jgi:hypothetical protein